MPIQICRAAVNSMISEQICEVEISYSSKIKASDRFKVCSSEDAMLAFRSVWPNMDHIEYSYVLLLNRRNGVLGAHQLSKGGMTGAIIDLRVIFQVAIKCCATSIILAHNHPSGNLNASDADRQITRKVAEAGKILDITLLDHLILTSESFHSMADNGEL